MYTLFDVECSNCDPLWAKIKDAVNPRYAEVRDKLQCMWETYEQYGDKNFRKEFALHTHQRFWEMYLASNLIEQGKNLVPRKGRDPSRPDILIEEERRIWIEAVSPTPGAVEHPDKVNPLLVDDESHSVPVERLLLRATSQLCGKNERFRQYRDDGIVAEGDICIIGINCGDMEGFELLSANYIANAFYPTRSKIWGEDSWTWYAPCQLPKGNGEIVQASLFTSSTFSFITGAIFSSNSISSLLKAETDFRYFPNPRSSRSLPPNWMPWSEETVVKGCHTDLVMETIKNGEKTSTVSGPFPSFYTP